MLSLFQSWFSTFLEWAGKSISPHVHLKHVLLSLQSSVCRKLLVCCGCMLFFLVVTRSLPIKYNVDHDFVSHAPFLSRLAYAFFSIQAARPKFYFAWTLGKHCVWVSVVVNQLAVGRMMRTLTALVLPWNSWSNFFSFFVLLLCPRVSWCSQQCCRLWFLGDGWKWEAILGPRPQPQHLWDRGVWHESTHRTLPPCVALYVTYNLRSDHDCFLFFKDCYQLQDVHRQLEYSDRDLAESVSVVSEKLYSAFCFSNTF